MPADPPPSLLITPDLRRRLQQRYEQAVSLVGSPHPDRACIHNLLAECLRTDPGNILYLEAVLANLRTWTNRPKPPAAGWFQRLFGGNKPRSVESEKNPQHAALTTLNEAAAHELLRQSPDLLLAHDSEPVALRNLAVACAACDFDEAELRYLVAAHDAEPHDGETLRMLARSLTRQGRFEAAYDIWDRLVANAPDQESAQAVQDLHLAPGGAPVAAAPADVSVHSTSAAEAVARSEALIGSGQLSLAEELLNNAQSTLGGDLSIRQAIEDLQLAKSQRRLEIARLRAAHDPHPKAQSCVGRLEAEHLRLEIDIFHVRCERFPTDVSLQLELARRLKRVGNYSGAIQRLEEATLGRMASEGSAPLMAAAFIELGECWQHLRQFPKAMGFYRRAIDAADPTTDDAKLANYRAGVLAAAMNDRQQARLHLAAVVAADPAFKDARERLDKLNST